MLIPTAIRSLLAICISLSVVRCHADIIVNSYTDATNDRFSNQPAFIMSGFDLSGIGQNGGGLWATAVSNNVVVSANHFAPSGTVYFFPGNNPGIAPIVRQIIPGSGQKIGATDIWLGVLDQPLPSTINHYAIANQFLVGMPPMGSMISIEAAGSYQGLNAYMFGRSPFDENNPLDNRFAYNDQAVGRNRITGYVENIPFSDSDNDSLIFNRDFSGVDFVTYETFLQGGDSGGPAFVDVDGQLVLLGTNAFVFDDNSASGINYLGNQGSTIQNFIQANAVPEPSACVLLALSGAVMAMRSRRNRR